MQCPNCKTENLEGARFCSNCGSSLPEALPKQEVNSSPNLQATPVIVTPKPQSTPVFVPLILGGLAPLFGGVLILLGWFLPWFGLGGLLSSGLGSLASGLHLPNFVGASVGNGLQLSLLSITAAFVGFSTKSGLGALFGLLMLVGFVVFLTIPILAVIIIRGSWRIVEEMGILRAISANKGGATIDVESVLQVIRKRSNTILVILVVIFVFAAAVPFMLSTLGPGFYFTAFGSGICSLSAYIAHIVSLRKQ